MYCSSLEEKMEKKGNKILVLGDLVVDYLIFLKMSQSPEVSLPPAICGGAGFNAARALQEYTSFDCVLFGKVGDDLFGNLIISELKKYKITSLITLEQSVSTSYCILIYDEEQDRRIVINNSQSNSNDYDLELISNTLSKEKSSYADYVFLPCHFIARLGIEHAKQVLEVIKEYAGLGVVIDLVPHDLYNHITSEEFQKLCEIDIYCIISEVSTLATLMNCDVLNKGFLVQSIFRISTIKFLVLRYGDEGIEYEVIYVRKSKSKFKKISDLETGYQKIEQRNKKGFGDVLTAKFFDNYLC